MEQIRKQKSRIIFNNVLTAIGGIAFIYISLIALSNNETFIGIFILILAIMMIFIVCITMYQHIKNKNV